MPGSDPSLRPLHSPQLRRILGAYTVNRLGSWVGLVALSLAVFDHTHSSLAVAGLLLAWEALPAFLVPVVVARVEVSRRRGELSALYLFEAVVTALLALLLSNFWLPAVLFLALLDGTAALAAGGLLRAEIAKVARAEVSEAAAHEAERAANAALNVCFSVSFLAGPLLGGLVTAAAGAPAALLIDVGSFVICAALLIDLHPNVVEAGGDSARARLRAAWAHIGSAGKLKVLLLTQAVALMFIQAAGPIEVGYAKATLDGGDGGYGLLVTAWGAGVVLASVLFARLARSPLEYTLSAGLFALGAAFVGFALAPTLAVASVVAVVGGVGNGLHLPSLMSLVQRLTPSRLHGRLMGAVESLVALSLAIGLPLGGVLVALSSERVAFLVIGAATAVTTIVSLPLMLAGPVASDAPVAEDAREHAPTADRDAPLEHVPAPPHVT